MAVRATVADLLRLVDAAAVRPVAGDARERAVEDVRMLFALEPPPPPVAAVVWVLPPIDTLVSPRLDSLLLALYRQEAAGLVVPLGRVAESTRLLAERLDFPLVAVDVARMDETVRAWRRHLDTVRLAAMQRVADLKGALLDEWLAAASLEAYLEGAGRVLGGRVAFAEDGAAETPPADGVRRHRPSVPWGKGLGAPLVVDLPRDLDEEAQLDVVRHVASLVAMRIDREVAAIESDIRVRGELLLELLVSESPGGSVLRAAQRFGLDLGRKHVVVLWDLDDFTSVSRRPDMHEARILRLKQDVLERLESGARRRFGRVWVLPHSDEFVLVVEADPREPEALALRRAMQDLQAGLAETLDRYGVLGISAGVGLAYSGSGGLRKSFEEAREALMVGLTQFGPRSVTHFKDLGIHRFLYGWVDSPRSRSLAADFLGPLLDGGGAGRSELLRTLRAYLESRGRASAVAQELGIHRNTLRYRLHRIEELLHVELDDPSTQLVLQLLVRALPGVSKVHKT
jgi:sugar diacid utilization regulator